MADENDNALLQAACAVGIAGPYRNEPAFENSGCGTFISENEVVTCWHVLATKEGLQVPRSLILVKNQKGEYSRVKKLVTEEGNDLAYLQLSAPIGQSHIHLNGRSGLNYDLTDKFTLLSNYKESPELDTSLLKTIFSKAVRLKAASRSGRFDIYLTETDIKKGYSGSAILVNGDICSVLSAKSLEYPGEIWAPGGYAFSRFVTKAREEASAWPTVTQGVFGFLKRHLLP